MAVRPAALRIRLLALAVFAVAVFFLPAAERASAGVVEPNFVSGTLNLAIDSPTSIAFGPDGRLYAAAQPGGAGNDGLINAYTLDPATKAVLGTESIETDIEDVMGIAFDPTAPASPIQLYASRRDTAATDGFENRISRLTGPTWTRTDIITGLPTGRPAQNHLTNGLAFDADGTLFIAQGSSTDAGLIDTIYWPETPLSAAILVADIDEPAFDGTITYSPAGVPMDHNVDQTGGDVSVFAPGLRNPFDLVIHSNGNMYATDNGPTGPDYSDSCVSSNSGGTTTDELNLIEAGNFYGFPNRNRGRTDVVQCTFRFPEEGDGAGFTGPIDILPSHCSCNGIAEFASDIFGGAMQGDLLFVGLQTSQVYQVELSLDGLSVVSNTTLDSGYNAPLDVTVGDDGTIYIAEFGGDRISVLAPDTDYDSCANSSELGSVVTLGGQRNPDNFWDFFDTPDAGNARDGTITVGDIFRIVGRFGTSGDSGIDPLSAPLASGYHTAFDRSPPSPGGQTWELNAPDGSITVGDIFFEVNQFGHACL